MRFNHDTSNNIPSDQIYNNLHNIPTAGYEAFGPIPQSQSQSQSIVNNMIYYQGIYYPINIQNCIAIYKLYEYIIINN